MTRTFAYRCGGSDGIAEMWLTVFPFNPLTEQSKGHLQTHVKVDRLMITCQAAGCVNVTLFQSCKPRLVRNGLFTRKGYTPDPN